MSCQNCTNYRISDFHCIWKYSFFLAVHLSERLRAVPHLQYFFSTSMQSVLNLKKFQGPGEGLQSFDIRASKFYPKCIIKFLTEDPNVLEGTIIFLQNGTRFGKNF